MVLSATTHMTNTAKGPECDDGVKHAEVLSSFRMNEVEDTARSVAKDRFLHCRYNYLKAAKFNSLTDCRVERLEIGCLGTISGEKSVYGSILGFGKLTLKKGVVVNGSVSCADDPEIDRVTIKGKLAFTMNNSDEHEIKNSIIGSIHILPEGEYPMEVIGPTGEEEKVMTPTDEVVIDVDPADFKVIQKPRCCSRAWFIYIAKLICDFFRSLFKIKKKENDSVTSPLGSLQVTDIEKRETPKSPKVDDEGAPRTLILVDTIVEGDITYSGAHLNVLLRGKSRLNGRVCREEAS